MIHPDTELRYVSDAVGVGVFATRPIPRGTITWVRDPFDQVIPAHVADALEPQPRAIVERYAWLEPEGYILCWDHARYVNHSCEANCMGLDLHLEIALRDIEPGEQLTDDYRVLGIFSDTFTCLCGSPACAGHVSPDQIPTMRPLWQTRVWRAADAFRDHPQPLLHWVRAEDQQALQRAELPRQVTRRAR